MPSPSALNDCTLWVHGYDFTGDSNKLKLGGSAEALDSTVFGSGGYRSRAGGKRDITVNASGLLTMGAGNVEAELFPELGTVDRVWTASPTGVATSVAYMFRAGKFDLELLGDHGALAPWSMHAMGTNSQGGAIRGQVAKAKGTVSATGALGSGLNLGAVGATQYLYGTFHIFSAGTTITVVLESDDNSGFTSATTVATLGPLTAAGGTWATRVAGALTDSFFRYRVTAITGTFTVAGAIGIGAL